MKTTWTTALLAVLPIVGMSAAAAADDAPPSLSPAQIALFESDHLKGIEHPERLEYRYRRESTTTGSPDAAFSDRVDLDVRPREDGKKDVWVDFLSGNRHQPFPPLMGFRGNPVLMFFLEHDVDEMNRETGGAAVYFRNRIRQAFVDRAQMKQVEIPHDGTEVAATEITLTPFKDDPNLAPFPGVADKRYRFLISDAIPGSIYEIDATVPGNAGDPPRIKDSMIFDSTQPCASGEGPCAAPSSAQ
ncbi:MAG TPA: hypothetical protein VMC10_10980 [Stellaceae bacterium]|nr:hypothetical protein [Stellaceae bacterium]